MAELDTGLFRALREDKKKIIVLDDDPTGIQTVHDVPVYTTYDQKDIQDIFTSAPRLSFILTNTRAMDRGRVRDINKAICQRIIGCSDAAGTDFEIISRSDSTLRGNYPLETDTIREVLEGSGRKVDGEILCFSFFETGRYTEGDVHYLMEEGKAVPVSQTEFSRDKEFGYRSSDLKKYIEEKTEGRYKASEVASISIEDIRRGGPEKIRKRLSSLTGFRKIIVNARHYRDLTAFITGLILSEKDGRRFIIRSAASLVKVRAGIPDKDNISRVELKKNIKNPSGKGLVIIGSHVEKTTLQLKGLLALRDAAAVEFDVTKTPDQDALREEIKRCRAAVNASINKNLTVLYTSRKLLAPVKGNINIPRTVSVALVHIVESIKDDPGFIIAKGGITSFDIAVKALKLKKATVLGQVINGVPLIILGNETRFPGIPYVIFPGNVGGRDSLKDVVQKFV